MTARLGRPPESERPDRIRDITDAAIEIFGRDGYAPATFSGIARAAGITPAALYRYFDDKAALYVHAARAARGRIWDCISERFDQSGDLVADFTSLIGVIGALPDEMSAGLRLLAALQVTAVHHPELTMSIDERFAVRDRVVGDLGRRAHRSGQLAGFDSEDDAALAIELVFSGLAVERYAYPHLQEALDRVAIRNVLALTRDVGSGGDRSCSGPPLRST